MLYSMAIFIYFKWFYKPLEMLPGNVDIPVIVSANETLKAINHDNMIFFFLLSFLFCILIGLILSMIYAGIVFYYTPVISSNARLKSKESIQQNGNYMGYMGFSSVGYTYNLTFETDNGLVLNFSVNPKHYIIIFEGNKGLLNYKHGVANRFISFDITAIE